MQLSNFSDSYIKSVEAGALFHQTHKTWSGKGTLQYKEYLKNLIQRYNIKTVLDFGCGKGAQYSKFNLDKELGIEVTQYDPCIHGLESWPIGKWDMVIALDCLKAIDKKDIDWLYDQFISWADKCIFIATQTEFDPKKDKTDLYKDLDRVEQTLDLVPTNFKKFHNPDFWIMDHFSFIIQP